MSTVNNAVCYCDSANTLFFIQDLAGNNDIIVSTSASLCSPILQWAGAQRQQSRMCNKWVIQSSGVLLLFTGLITPFTSVSFFFVINFQKKILTHFNPDEGLVA